MEERRDEMRGSGVRLTRLVCRRTGAQVELAEHAQCPYCFGCRADLEQGEHQAFCDYRPEVDPLQFGFPPDSTRHRSG